MSLTAQKENSVAMNTTQACMIVTLGSELDFHGKTGRLFNACRMKTWPDEMVSGCSRSLVTSNLKKNKTRIICRAGLPFYFFYKKNGKRKLAHTIQPSNA